MRWYNDSRCTESILQRMVQNQARNGASQEAMYLLRKTDSRTKRGMNACMKCAIKHSEYSHKSYMKRKEREKERKNQQQ